LRIRFVATCPNDKCDPLEKLVDYDDEEEEDDMVVVVVRIVLTWNRNCIP